MKEVKIVKLGGSLITDKSQAYVFKPEIVRSLAKELGRIISPLILIHGSGSFGHVSAAKYGGARGYKSRQGIAKVSRDAMEINRLVMDVLIEQGVPAVSVRPGGMILASEGEQVKHRFEIIEEILNQRLVPVLYGDVIWDTEWKSTIFSGEKISADLIKFLLSQGWKISKVIHVGNTDGVYDQNGDTIPLITADKFESIKEFIEDVQYADVTGGMNHKIEESLAMSKLGIQTYIIDGNRESELTDVLEKNETKGTVIR